jgi:hypothetical protein
MICRIFHLRSNEGAPSLEHLLHARRHLPPREFWRRSRSSSLPSSSPCPLTYMFSTRCPLAPTRSSRFGQCVMQRCRAHPPQRIGSCCSLVHAYFALLLSGVGACVIPLCFAHLFEVASWEMGIRQRISVGCSLYHLPSCRFL